MLFMLILAIIYLSAGSIHFSFRIVQRINWINQYILIIVLLPVLLIDYTTYDFLFIVFIREHIILVFLNILIVLHVSKAIIIIPVWWKCY